MNADIDLRVERPGYVPGGAGVIRLTIVAPPRGLTGLALADAGTLDRLRGIANASLLVGRRVGDRIGAACEAALEQEGLGCEIERVLDNDAPHAGANLSIWGESSTRCRLAQTAPENAAEPQKRSVSLSRVHFWPILAPRRVNHHASDRERAAPRLIRTVERRLTAGSRPRAGVDDREHSGRTRYRDLS
jgi:hypothetical protein